MKKDDTRNISTYSILINVLYYMFILCILYLLFFIFSFIFFPENTILYEIIFNFINPYSFLYFIIPMLILCRSYLHIININFSKIHINVRSKNLFLRKKNYVKIPKKLLSSYSFYEKPFSFNTILVIRTSINGKKKNYRFLISMLNTKKRKIISEQFTNILSDIL